MADVIHSRTTQAARVDITYDARGKAGGSMDSHYSRELKVQTMQSPSTHITKKACERKFKIIPQIKHQSWSEEGARQTTGHESAFSNRINCSTPLTDSADTIME